MVGGLAGERAADYLRQADVVQDLQEEPRTPNELLDDYDVAVRAVSDLLHADDTRYDEADERFYVSDARRRRTAAWLRGQADHIEEHPVLYRVNDRLDDVAATVGEHLPGEVSDDTLAGYTTGTLAAGLTMLGGGIATITTGDPVYADVTATVGLPTGLASGGKQVQTGILYTMRQSAANKLAGWGDALDDEIVVVDD